MEIDSIWEIKECEDSNIEEIKSKLGLSTIVARLLIQRGINTYDKASKFIYGKLEDLSDPFNLSGMQVAVDRIEMAINNKEKVVIYGDYDVDGICSILLLKKCLKVLGCEADYYIPDRFAEGYGLNLQAIEKLAAQGYKLLITVDCGISSVEEVNKAVALGMDVIMTDHHTPAKELPPAAAVINPKLDNDQDSQDLAGVGVAFKLAMALCRDKTPAGLVFEWLDLVALATVADIVPLLGDNRILVKYGLKQLKDTKIKGLKALINETGLQGKELAPWHIAFVLAPRLNAAGRLKNARLCVELLLAEDDIKAAEFAENLCNINNERKLIEESIYKEAILQINTMGDLEKEWVLVLGGENWHRGVIGIVASRISEKYNRPVILISWEGETGRGSGRSIEGLNIYEALFSCRQYLVQYGGHKMAAGLELNKNNFTVFKQKICKFVKENITAEKLYKRQNIDSEIELDEINQDLLKEMELLKPYGEGNPCPRFALRSVEIGSSILVGKNREHFKARIISGDFEGIAFNRPEFKKLPLNECYCDAVCEVGENEFRGKKNIQLKIKDMKCTFLPDNLNSSYSINEEFSSIIKRSVNEIINKRTVLLIYPTHRSLVKHKIVLENFFRSHMLQELHGRLFLPEREKVKKEFELGVSKIFLTTESFLKYYLMHKKLPENLNHIVQFWPQDIKREWINCQNTFDIETYHGIKRNLKWIQAEWDFDNSKRTVVYTSRVRTIEKLSRELSNIIIEAGVKEVRKRKALHRQFMTSSSTVLVWDGGCTGGLCNIDKIDEVFFADVPYSSYETMLMLDQIVTEDEVKVVALFQQDDLDYNRSYLERLFPGLQTIKTVLHYFKNVRKNPVRLEINKLVQSIADFTDRDFRASDLFPVLYILVDLGLCHVKKKGSIIEIKFINTDKQVLDVSNSPYYLEGLAEKNAFARWEKEIKQSLAW